MSEHDLTGALSFLDIDGLVGDLVGTAGGVLNTVGEVVTDLPIVGEALEPVVGVVGDVADTAGGLLVGTVDAATDVLDGLLGHLPLPDDGLLG